MKKKSRALLFLTDDDFIEFKKPQKIDNDQWWIESVDRHYNDLLGTDTHFFLTNLGELRPGWTGNVYDVVFKTEEDAMNIWTYYNLKHQGKDSDILTIVNSQPLFDD
jgi:hypothetical protein